jgi:hypothetical protein
MKNKEKTTDEICVEDDQSTLCASSYDTEDVFAGAEEWSPTETKLVLWSFGSALVSLVLFSFLLNKYMPALTH